MLITNGKVVLPDRVIEGGAVVVEDGTGRVEAVGSRADVRGPHDGETVIDAEGGLIAPGFIDMHCHGGWGSDFMDGTPEDFDRISAFHALHGVTSMCAVSASAPLAVIEQMLESTREVKARGTPGAQILGAHLEGPWLNEDWRGCHPVSEIRPPSEVERRTVLDRAADIRMVTLSPEIPGCIELTRELTAAGIVVSAGHSSITWDEMIQAIEAGVRHVAHIYSAMSTVIRKGPWRHPGLLETALAHDRLTTEMIADGKHLPAPLMTIAYRCKGPDKLCLVSDAMRGAGMKIGGKYTFGTRDGNGVVIADGVAMLPDMTAFASSITPIDAMIRNTVEMVGVPIHEAIRMATLTPARVLGIADRKGSLEPGKDADLCILDDSFNAKHVVVGGKLLDKQGLLRFAPPEADL